VRTLCTYSQATGRPTAVPLCVPSLRAF
jgi:hypothetical protein